MEEGEEIKEKVRVSYYQIKRMIKEEIKKAIEEEGASYYYYWFRDNFLDRMMKEILIFWNFNYSFVRRRIVNVWYRHIDKDFFNKQNSVYTSWYKFYKFFEREKGEGEDICLKETKEWYVFITVVKMDYECMFAIKFNKKYITITKEEVEKDIEDMLELI